MPRYYFDMREGDEIAPDDEGMELHTIEAVQEEAARSLADMARDAIRRSPNGAAPNVYRCSRRCRAGVAGEVHVRGGTAQTLGPSQLAEASHRSGLTRPGAVDEGLRQRRTLLFLVVGLGRSIRRGIPAPARKPHRLHTIALPAAVSDQMSALTIRVGPLQLRRCLQTMHVNRSNSGLRSLFIRCRKGNGPGWRRFPNSVATTLGTLSRGTSWSSIKTRETDNDDYGTRSVCSGLAKRPLDGGPSS
jgi:hypothetical protein